MHALRITSLCFVTSLAACRPLSFDPDANAGGAAGEAGNGSDLNATAGTSGGPVGSTGGTTGGGGMWSAVAGAATGDVGGIGGTGGRTSPPSLPPGNCQERSLDVTWPVISGCLQPAEPGFYESTRLRCPFPEQLNVPDYGPFVGCCAPEFPYSCPNGTPHSCYATAAEAEAACAGACVICVEHSAGGVHSE